MYGTMHMYVDLMSEMLTSIAKHIILSSLMELMKVTRLSLAPGTYVSNTRAAISKPCRRGREGGRDRGGMGGREGGRERGETERR